MSYNKALIPGVQRDAVFDDVKHTDGYAYHLACKGRYNEAIHYWNAQNNEPKRYEPGGNSMQKSIGNFKFETPEEMKANDAKLLARQQLTQCAESDTEYHSHYCTFCRREFMDTGDGNECSMKCRIDLASSSNGYRKYLIKQSHQLNAE